MEKESLEALLGRGESVERIAKRFGKDPSTVSYWMKKYGLTSPYAEKHAAKGGIERERLEALVDAGLSIAGIAEALGAAKRRSGTGSGSTSSRRQVDRASRWRKHGWHAGKRVSSLRHDVSHATGRPTFTLEGRGYYRCQRCRASCVARRRRRVKASRCRGGRRRVRALRLRPLHRARSSFTTLIPTQKRLHISSSGHRRSASTCCAPRLRNAFCSAPIATRRWRPGCRPAATVDVADGSP